MRARQKEGRITLTVAVTTPRRTVGMLLMLMTEALTGVMDEAMVRAAAVGCAGAIDAVTACARATVVVTMRAVAGCAVAAVDSTDPSSALSPVAPLPGARTGTR